MPGGRAAVRRLSTVLGVLASSASTAALFAPWVTALGVPLSSLELLSNAAAFGVIEGTTKVLIMGAWMALPTSTASSLVLAAMGRRRPLAIALLLPVAVYSALIIGLTVASNRSMEWGLWLGLGSGVVSAACAVLLWTVRSASLAG